LEGVLDRSIDTDHISLKADSRLSNPSYSFQYVNSKNKNSQKKKSRHSVAPHAVLQFSAAEAKQEKHIKFPKSSSISH